MIIDAKISVVIKPKATAIKATIRVVIKILSRAFSTVFIRLSVLTERITRPRTKFFSDP